MSSSYVILSEVSTMYIISCEIERQPKCWIAGQENTNPDNTGFCIAHFRAFRSPITASATQPLRGQLARILRQPQNDRENDKILSPMNGKQKAEMCISGRHTCDILRVTTCFSMC